jgi:acetolactate synthase-1/3 small subunit
LAIHNLAVLVENSPGVLARVASLFSRRGYNIDSLAVGPTENPKVSRMTIVLNLEGHALDQVSAQLFKLVNVIGISEMKDSDSLKREILLVKVVNTPATKEIISKHKAVISDEAAGTISIEAVGQSSEIEALLKELRPHGIRELVQSGLVALERGDKTLADRTLSTMGTANESNPNSSTADYQN